MPLLDTRHYAAAAALAVSLAGPAARAQDAANRCTVNVGTWAIQLENITVDGIRSTRDDLFIIDINRNGEPGQQFTRDEIAAMKVGPDGRRRLILGYLSIAQAEDYRSYWQEDWNAAPPAWLDVPDPDWNDNYETRFWDPDWQALVYGSEGAMLDTVLDLGFDGAMFDGVDAFETWAGHRPDAKTDMVSFVGDLAEYARARDPQFLVFLLNAENLLSDPSFSEKIDGIVKEDLFFGQEHRAQRNDQAMIDWAQSKLKLAQDRGLPVFVLEYLPEGALRDEAADEIDAGGYLGSFAERQLSDLSQARPAADGAFTSLTEGAACREH